MKGWLTMIAFILLIAGVAYWGFTGWTDTQDQILEKASQPVFGGPTEEEKKITALELALERAELNLKLCETGIKCNKVFLDSRSASRSDIVEAEHNLKKLLVRRDALKNEIMDLKDALGQ